MHGRDKRAAVPSAAIGTDASRLWPNPNAAAPVRPLGQRVALPNYHHLLLFWTVARQGGVGRAARHLGIGQPAVSTQLKQLEATLGAALFDRVGGAMVLTDAGRTTFAYAEEIFALGEELDAVVRGGRVGPAPRVGVGVSDAVPKSVAHRLLAAVLSLEQAPRLIVTEDRTERLLAELALHRLDVVLADAPMPPGVGVRAFHHPLGDTGLRFCATPTLADPLRATFPASLDGAPMLMPSVHAAVRPELDRWLSSRGLHPRVVAELDDSALTMTFGREGAGVFSVPAAVSQDVCALYGVVEIGGTDEVRERFFAITMERRVQHPAVLAIRAAAGRILLPVR